MDRQITGLAGEYFVAAELLKRGYQVAMTMGNAKAVDLMVQVPATRRMSSVEVKTLRHPNCFAIKLAAITEDLIYVFVILHDEGTHPEFFVLRGTEILRDPNQYFGSSLGRADGRDTINYGPLKVWKDRWDLFEG